MYSRVALWQEGGGVADGLADGRSAAAARETTTAMWSTAAERRPTAVVPASIEEAR